nr:uncharacterized protein LOC112009816 isoform X3 [Quercus suber]
MACVGSLMPRPSQCLMYTTTATTTCKTKHSSSLLPFTYPRNSSRRRIVSVRAESSSSMATESEKLGIKIERNPPDSKLTQLGVRNWPKHLVPSLIAKGILIIFLLATNYHVGLSSKQIPMDIRYKRDLLSA